MDSPMSIPPSILATLRPLLSGLQQPVYLVGGAVRDLLLGRESHDLDFVVPDRAIKTAFKTADFLGLPAYILDRERDTGRVVLPDGRTLDFACFRGDDLEADLCARDFTINAMALLVTADEVPLADALVDPCDGQQDLGLRLIRQTHDQAIAQDTVRALRAARLAADLQFTLHPTTAAAMTAAASHLTTVSVERVRDELLRLLMAQRPAVGLQLLGEAGITTVVLPEVAALEEVKQSAPHHEPVGAHTRRVLRWLPRVEAAVVAQLPDELPALRRAQTELAALAGSLHDYLQEPVDGGLTNQAALRLAALFHDVGKAETQAITADGRIRFLNHDQVGAELAGRRLRQLRYSNDLVQTVTQIVAGHMRPLLLAQVEALSRRAAYRYFRTFDQNGIAIGLLALADHLATYDPAAGDGPPDNAAWARLLAVVSGLYALYFHGYEEVVRPTPLLDGRTLMRVLNLKAGPEVGRLLGLIEEAQAVGLVQTADEALALARQEAEKGG
jgi:poly(A) polymerase